MSSQESPKSERQAGKRSPRHSPKDKKNKNSHKNQMDSPKQQQNPFKHDSFLSGNKNNHESWSQTGGKDANEQDWDQQLEQTLGRKIANRISMSYEKSASALSDSFVKSKTAMTNTYQNAKPAFSAVQEKAKQGFQKLPSLPESLNNVFVDDSDSEDEHNHHHHNHGHHSPKSKGHHHSQHSPSAKSTKKSTFQLAKKKTRRWCRYYCLPIYQALFKSADGQQWWVFAASNVLIALYFLAMFGIPGSVIFVMYDYPHVATPFVCFYLSLEILWFCLELECCSRQERAGSMWRWWLIFVFPGLLWYFNLQFVVMSTTLFADSFEGCVAILLGVYALKVLLLSWNSFWSESKWVSSNSKSQQIENDLLKSDKKHDQPRSVDDECESVSVQVSHGKHHHDHKKNREKSPTQNKHKKSSNHEIETRSKKTYFSNHLFLKALYSSISVILGVGSMILAVYYLVVPAYYLVPFGFFFLPLSKLAMISIVAVLLFCDASKIALPYNWNTKSWDNSSWNTSAATSQSPSARNKTNQEKETSPRKDKDANQFGDKSVDEILFSDSLNNKITSNNYNPEEETLSPSSLENDAYEKQRQLEVRKVGFVLTFDICYFFFAAIQISANCAIFVIPNSFSFMMAVVFNALVDGIGFLYLFGVFSSYRVKQDKLFPEMYAGSISINSDRFTSSPKKQNQNQKKHGSNKLSFDFDDSFSLLPSVGGKKLARSHQQHGQLASGNSLFLFVFINDVLGYFHSVFFRYTSSSQSSAKLQYQEGETKPLLGGESYNINKSPGKSNSGNQSSSSNSQYQSIEDARDNEEKNDYEQQPEDEAIANGNPFTAHFKDQLNMKFNNDIDTPKLLLPPVSKGFPWSEEMSQQKQSQTQTAHNNDQNQKQIKENSITKPQQLTSYNKRFQFLEEEVNEMVLLHYNDKSLMRSQYVTALEDKHIGFIYFFTATVGCVFSILGGPFVLERIPQDYFVLHMLWRVPVFIFFRMFSDLLGYLYLDWQTHGAIQWKDRRFEFALLRSWYFKATCIMLPVYLMMAVAGGGD